LISLRKMGRWWATLESNQAWVSPAELQSDLDRGSALYDIVIVDFKRTLCSKMYSNMCSKNLKA